MTDTARRRGRPKGSGKNDTALLNAVASKLLATPSMKPSAAMKQVIAKNPQPNTTPETLLRRLQVKWKAQSAVLTDAARKRAEAQRAREQRSREEAANYGASNIPRSFALQFEEVQRMVDRMLPATDQLKKYQDMLNPPGMSAFKKVMEQHHVIDNALNYPGMSAYKRMLEQQQRIQDLIDPPRMRAIREALKRYGQYPY